MRRITTCRIIAPSFCSVKGFLPEFLGGRKKKVHATPWDAVPDGGEAVGQRHPNRPGPAGEHGALVSGMLQKAVLPVPEVEKRTIPFWSKKRQINDRLCGQGTRLIRYERWVRDIHPLGPSTIGAVLR